MELLTDLNWTQIFLARLGLLARLHSRGMRRTTALLQRAPYLGPLTATSPSCSLRALRWRSSPRSLPLDLLTDPSLLRSKSPAVSFAVSSSPNSRLPFKQAHSSF